MKRIALAVVALMSSVSASAETVVITAGRMLDVASGRKTWAEHWKLHNALVLFNPAPIT